jgi:hypothetical protein
MITFAGLGIESPSGVSGIVYTIPETIVTGDLVATYPDDERHDSEGTTEMELAVTDGDGGGRVVGSIPPEGTDRDGANPTWWENARPHMKRYGKSFAIAGPFGVALTGVGDSAPMLRRK